MDGCVAQHMLSVLSVKSYDCVIIKSSGLASSGLKIYFALDAVVGVYANSIFRAYSAQRAFKIIFSYN
jgi:hypothetical protein